MKIDINDHRRIYSIEEEFSGLFPNLALQFFARPPHEHDHSSKAERIHGSDTLGKYRIEHHKGTLTVTPNMTAGDLEDNFRSVYGLHVHVVARRLEKILPLESYQDKTLAVLDKESAVLLAGL